MAYDLLIKNGWVVDGSGRPRYRADVGVRGGKIAAIGRIRESAKEVLDAEGQVVAPGFVDGHTHMDAQIFWDPLGTCSCWHGITTVVMGNCGFTLAPCAKEDRHLVIRNLQRAEDISLGGGTTTIPAGATSVDVPVPVLDDGIDEDDETFTIVLGDISHGIKFARSQATGTIVDDDAPPSISVAPVTVTEGNTSLTDAIVSVASKETAS